MDVATVPEIVDDIYDSNLSCATHASSSSSSHSSVWRQWIAMLIRDTIVQQRYIGLPRSTVLLLSRHPYLPLSYVEEFRSAIPWDMHSIASHPEMTRRFHEKYFSPTGHRQRSSPPFSGYAPHCRKIAHFQGQQSFSFAQFERRPYSKTYLTYHPKLTIALVLHLPSLGWDYKFLLLYREWTCAQIHKLLDLRRMDWKAYSQNPFLTIETVREFLRYPWEWAALARSPCFPPQRVFEDPILMPRWKWRSVFKNPRISTVFWKHLLTNFPRTVHDPLIILHNRFEYDPCLQAWATFHIHGAIGKYRDRRLLRTKLTHLRFLHQTLPLDVVRTVLTFV